MSAESVAAEGVAGRGTEEAVPLPSAAGWPDVAMETIPSGKTRSSRQPADSPSQAQIIASGDWATARLKDSRSFETALCTVLSRHVLSEASCTE